MSNFVRNYYPQRPVKSFQDLEVYQKLLAVSVAVAKRIKSQTKDTSDGGPEQSRRDSSEVSSISGKAISLALNLPIKIATAHSLRFGDHAKAVLTLEEVMLDCNLLIVYLEQYRDIVNVPLPKLTAIGSKSLPKADAPIAEADITEIENEFFEEQIRTLLTTRFKVLHLQQSWKKFDKEKEAEK